MAAQLREFSKYGLLMGTEEAEINPVEERIVKLIGQKYLEKLGNEDSSNSKSYINFFKDFKNFHKIKNVLDAYFASHE
jgi:hypothetical protein